MFVIISPAKSLDFETAIETTESANIRFNQKTQNLVLELQKLSSNDIAKLMGLSLKLSDLNYERFQKYAELSERPCAYAFTGDTYKGLEFNKLNQSEVKYAQQHLRILSGLYGLLRPLDNIKPYRLEMGTKFQVAQSKNLYEWWREDVTDLLKKDMAADDILVNLASKEYFSVIDFKRLNKTVITPLFLDEKNGQYKTISFFAKRARGMMAQFILKKRPESVKELTQFDSQGYTYCKMRSNLNKGEIVFTRPEQ